MTLSLSNALNAKPKATASVAPPVWKGFVDEDGNRFVDPETEAQFKEKKP